MYKTFQNIHKGLNNYMYKNAIILHGWISGECGYTPIFIFGGGTFLGVGDTVLGAFDVTTSSCGWTFSGPCLTL